MSEQKVTVRSCDGCGARQEATDAQAFAVEGWHVVHVDDDSMHAPTKRLDLCGACCKWDAFRPLFALVHKAAKGPWALQERAERLFAGERVYAPRLGARGRWVRPDDPSDFVEHNEEAIAEAERLKAQRS